MLGLFGAGIFVAHAVERLSSALTAGYAYRIRQTLVLHEASDGKRTETRRTLKNAVGEVELDRLLLDAVRRAIEPELPTATNDNQLAWPLISFPEGWYSA